MASLPPRTLFTQLIDDAAVFPPGNCSLSEAIERRSARRSTPAADFVGPLLLPPRLIDEALADHTGLVIAVVGRRGTPVEDVVTAAERVAGSTGHSLAGVEVAAGPGWEQVLELAVPVAVEVELAPRAEALLEVGDPPRAVDGAGADRRLPPAAALADLRAQVVRRSRQMLDLAHERPR